MGRIGSLKKLGDTLGSTFIKRAKPHGRIGGKLPRWFDSSGKMIRRTNRAKSAFHGIDQEHTAIDYVEKIRKKHVPIQYYEEPSYIRTKPKSEGSGDFERGVGSPRAYLRQKEIITGRQERMAMVTTKPALKMKRTPRDYESITGRDFKGGNPQKGVSYHRRRTRMRTGESESIYRPKPVRIKPKIEPTRTQAALTQLRAAEQGPSALMNPGPEDMNMGRQLMDQVQPGGQPVEYGRLNQLMNPGDIKRAQEMKPHDFPLDQAKAIAIKQAGMPEAERTMFPETRSLPDARVLSRMEGGQPQFENRTYKQIGDLGSRVVNQSNLVSKAGTAQLPIEQLSAYGMRLDSMWKAIGGLRSIEGRKWKNFLGNVFRRGGAKGKDPADAFMKVGLEWFADPDKASKKYPKPLILSLERAFEVYKQAGGK